MPSSSIPVRGLDAAKFSMQSGNKPAGDQPKAIAALTKGLEGGKKLQTLKGVTGSGKTYTMAKVIERMQKPALVLSHNKTLAAQLYREFKEFFPDNAVEYFVSYYDYYQPEAYVPGKDLFIEKDASINSEIEKLRLAATTSLYTRRDVIIVATVSCIYGLGNPEDYAGMSVIMQVGDKIDALAIRAKLVALQYERNDAVLERARFRMQDDVLDIYPAYEDCVYRVRTEWDVVTGIEKLHAVTLEKQSVQDKLWIFPAKHFVTPREHVQRAIKDIRAELKARKEELLAADKLVEAQRLTSRTEYDLEMLEELNFCSGIENYSMHLSGRKPGDRPAVLLDYFPKDFLMFIDESHVTVPQVGAMYNGDRARKLNLVEYGFRLPSACDNRPLRFEEFEGMIHQCVFVSATPGPYELSHAKKPDDIVEQVIRPTGLLDPRITLHKTEGQIEHLLGEIRTRVAAGERTLVTTLTKRMAENISDYLSGLGIKVSYLHSDIDTMERVEILVKLRSGEIDVVVGINLLREGLDLPEVSLVAILDADKIGFLRSATSLIQTIGRAARNVNGQVIMYADETTDAMKTAIEETDRRRALQQAHNEANGITPASVKKAVRDILVRTEELKQTAARQSLEVLRAQHNMLVPKERKLLLQELVKRMNEHADMLEFEEAAVLRDEIERLKKGQ